MSTSSTLFPVLELEEDLQQNDKTRLSAVKSFVGAGTATIADVNIKPELTASGYSVFGADPNNWYLDWAYSNSTFTTDIDSTNNAIDFSEGAGSPVVGLVAGGTYSLTQLAAAIKAAMEAVSPGNLTYTCTYDTYNRLTISTTAPLSLYPEYGANRDTQILKNIGFIRENKYQQLNSVTGWRTEYVTKKVTLTLTDSSNNTATLLKYIRLFDLHGDYLWSTDSQIKEHEPNILRYIDDGRSSHNNKHRLAQKEILRWLDRKGYVDVYNDPFIKWSLPKLDELKDWSKFTTLRLIYSGLVVQKDDIFDKKSISYKGMEIDARNRAVLRLDVDGDGKVDTFENLGIQSGTVVRR